MKGGNWIPLDKALVRFLPKTRSYTYLEAMYSLTFDIDNGKKGSIKGYASLWGWSRNKARKFIKELGTPKGHMADTKGTHKGHPIRLINNTLQGVKDTKRTHKGHKEDTLRTPTIYPNPKPKPKPKDIYGEFENVLLTKDEYAKLKEKFGNDTEWHIQNLSTGIESKGYVYKSHYATILAWHRKNDTGGKVEEDGTVVGKDGIRRLAATGQPCGPGGLIV